MKFAWLCSHESYQPEILVEQAVSAEVAGFDMVLGSDHFHPWVDDESAAGFVWSWFGAVAARTERIRLATSVTCPLFHYHPALIAQAAATIDRLSAGRFVLGVGTGEAINEAPLGWAFPAYGERAARLDEAIDIMRSLLAGEKVTHAGHFYRVDRARLYSPPTGRVPIWMAAGGPKSASFAGRKADGLIVSVKDPEVAMSEVIGPFREAAGGRAVEIMATRWTILADTDDEAWRAIASMRGLRAPGRLEAVDPMELRERADAMDPAEILGKFAIARSIDDLVDLYRPLVQAVGADVVSVQIASLDPERTIEQVGAELLPRLREIAAVQPVT